MFQFIHSKVAAAACGAVVCLAQIATGQTVFVKAQQPFMYSVGGEFNITPIGFAQQFVALTGSGDVETFCFQAQVPIVPGTLYNGDLAPLTPPGGPNLTEQVAFLYSKFILGELNIMHNGVLLYNYADVTPNGRITYAAALQYAIWELTSQPLPGGMAFNPRPNVTTELKNYAMANAQAGNFYDVQLLVMSELLASHTTGDNVNRGGTQYVQSQLVKLVPTPGAASLLAIGGLIAVRRRRARA